MTLVAYRHQTRSGAPHLRCKQVLFSEVLKHALQRVGSPAVWIQKDMAWSWPLTPAAVIRLDQVAKEHSETVEWQDGLREFADAHVKQNNNEHQVRLAIEKIIREKPALEAYVTRLADDDGTPKPPLYHQQVTYQWSQRVNGLLLAHDPGTGKTRSASDAAGGWYRNALIQPMQPMVKNGKMGVKGGVLVVSPKTVVRTWGRELSYWQNASSIAILGTAVRKTRLAATPAHFHVTNYEGLKYVEHNEYDAVIFDEIHYLGYHSQRTIYAQNIVQHTKKRLGLSGTPIANRLETIFYPMLIIDGGKSLGASKTAFMEKFFNSINAGQFTKHEAKDGAAQAIAAAMAESTYFVTKEEVLPYLPKKTHTPRYLDMTDEQFRYYRQVKTEAISYIQDSSVTISQASVRMMKLLQICQGFVLADEGGRHFSDAKSDALFELLTDTLSNRKVIVWAYFTYEIQRLVNELNRLGIPNVRVDGTVTSQKARDEAMDRWNTQPDLRVYLRQMSMSEGVTLHANESEVPCFDSIYMGLSYRYIDWRQSQDRIHRIGQQWPCAYTYFLTENGIDRHVYDAVMEKSAVVSEVHELGKDHYLKLLRAS